MDEKNIKVVFMGTSNFAVPILKKLMEKFDVRLLVCAPDKPVGRHQLMTPPPTKKFALAQGLPIDQPVLVKNNKNFISKLKQLDADLIVVAAYGKILPAEIINLPKHGCLNIHPSLLPKFRGPSPIQSALLAGENETGVTIMLMDEGMDTGDIIQIEVLTVEESDYYSTLEHKLSDLAADMLVKLLGPYINGRINLETQDDDEATYCTKITSAMGRIDWTKPTSAIRNQIRALAETEGVYTMMGDKRLYIEQAKVFESKEDLDAGPGTLRCLRDEQMKKRYAVKCGDGWLELIVVKLEGKQSSGINNFLNGHQKLINSQLQ